MMSYCVIACMMHAYLTNICLDDNGKTLALDGGMEVSASCIVSQFKYDFYFFIFFTLDYFTLDLSKYN